MQLPCYFVLMYFLVLVICIFSCSCCKALYSESIYLNKYSASNVTKYLSLHFKYTLHDVRSHTSAHRKLAPKVIPSNNFPVKIKAKRWFDHVFRYKAQFLIQTTPFNMHFHRNWTKDYTSRYKHFFVTHYVRYHCQTVLTCIGWCPYVDRLVRFLTAYQHILFI